MGNAPQIIKEKIEATESNEDLNSQRRKRNRITKKAEKKVHQWTFSTEVK